MPLVDDEQLTTLLADERITAITVDTNIFDEKGLQLNSPVLQVLASLRGRPFSFILSGTVAKEIHGHIERAIESALRAAKREIGQALYAFETEKPTRDELLAQVSGGRTASEAAAQRLDKFIADTGCEVLDDAPLADLASIYADYFAKNPPFSSGKKSEFPDALALNALENMAGKRGIGVLVVSKDGDWRGFCASSERLYLVPNIERALALINNAPLGLRRSVAAWFETASDERAEFFRALEQSVERIDFTVTGTATSGEMEAYAWGGDLKDVAWLDNAQFDIIESETPGDGTLRVIVSLPLLLTACVHVELSFSVWDSIDRESISMGGREVEIDEELDVLATVTLRIHGLGTEDEEILFEDSELDTQYQEINLGDVDVFEPEDYWAGDEPE